MDDLVERYTAEAMSEALRLHAFDDCDGADLPTHLCNIAASFVTAQASRITALDAELKTVLDREAETIARYDAKLDALEAELLEQAKIVGMSGERELALLAKVERLTADKAGLVAEVAVLKQNVIAFCGPWATQYAGDQGFSSGHLHPVHYDILEKSGARMADFTRAALEQHGGEK